MFVSLKTHRIYSLTLYAVQRAVVVQRQNSWFPISWYGFDSHLLLVPVFIVLTFLMCSTALLGNRAVLRNKLFNMDMKIISIILTIIYALAAIINFGRTCTAKKWSDGFTAFLALIIQCVTIFLIWNWKYCRRAPSTADVGQQLPYKECNSICDGKMNEKCHKNRFIVAGLSQHCSGGACKRPLLMGAVVKTSRKVSVYALTSVCELIVPAYWFCIDIICIS